MFINNYSNILTLFVINDPVLGVGSQNPIKETETALSHNVRNSRRGPIGTTVTYCKVPRSVPFQLLGC